MRYFQMINLKKMSNYMSESATQQYSTDPYFNSLCLSESNLANDVCASIFLAFSRTPTAEMAAALINDEYTPWEILRKLTDHPEFNPQLLASVFRHPNCDPEFLQRAVQSDDEFLQASAAASNLLNREQIETLKSTGKEEVFYNLIISGHLNDEELFSYVSNSQNLEEGSHLLVHPSLSDEVKVGLSLLGIIPITHSLLRPSSRISYVAFQVGQPVQALEFFMRQGHPAGLFRVGPKSEVAVTPNIQDIKNLWQYEIIHQALWPEVSLLHNARLLYNPSNYEGDIVTLAHEEFNEWNIDNLGDIQRSSLRGEVDVTFFLTYTPNWCHVAPLSFESLFARNRSSFKDLVYDGVLSNFDEFEPQDLALFVLLAQGIHEDLHFTESGKERLLSMLEEEVLHSGSFEFDIKIDWELVAPFKWSSLGDAKQDQAIRFLVEASKLSNDGVRFFALHFLSCIILHPKTPVTLLHHFEKNSEEWIKRALQVRESAN